MITVISGFVCMCKCVMSPSKNINSCTYRTEHWEKPFMKILLSIQIADACWRTFKY